MNKNQDKRQSERLFGPANLTANEWELHLAAIRPGDRVTIRTPQGNERHGRVVIKNLAARSLVLNGGGHYGTPLVATILNFVSSKAASRQAEA